MEKEIIVEAALENLQTILDFASKQLKEQGCSLKIFRQIELVVEEIFVNITNYAYKPLKGNATFVMKFENNPSAIVIIFKDNGMPYNPLEHTDPDVSAGLEERLIGGLGIFLVKKNVDEIFYAYEDGMNILTMKKFL